MLVTYEAQLQLYLKEKPHNLWLKFWAQKILETHLGQWEKVGFGAIVVINL